MTAEVNDLQTAARILANCYTFMPNKDGYYVQGIEEWANKHGA